MTCIIGLEHDGKVYIGGDSQSSGGWDKGIAVSPKVFRRGDFLIGYTDSWRMGQILQYHLSVRPPLEGETDDAYMVIAFIEAVRDCLRQYGYMRIDSNTETGGQFLVGYKAKLYRIDADFQVLRFAEDMSAVGCGAAYALGALMALTRSIFTVGKPFDPVEVIGTALSVAQRFSNGVGDPFTILDI